MTATTLDAPLLDNTDSPLARPLPPDLRAARADVLAAARELLSIPEEALTKIWTWKGGSEEEVRYGAYRAAEALEQAEIEARRTIAATDAGERRAARIVGPATAARWDLHGLLVPLDDALLDAEPGGGEWSIRLVLGHIISSQRAYGWGSAWWQTHGHDANDPALPKGAPDAFWAALPDEARRPRPMAASTTCVGASTRSSTSAPSASPASRTTDSSSAPGGRVSRSRSASGLAAGRRISVSTASRSRRRSR